MSYTCEHCGQLNTFSLEIVGNASAEVRFGTGDKRTQQKISGLGAKAQNDLQRQIMKAQNDADKENFAWLKFHKCSKCKYPQSWQKAGLWRNTILFFIVDFFYLLIFFSWVTASSSDPKTVGAWGGFLLVGVLLFLPIINLILNLRKIDKSKHEKPIVII
ncbi:MAG: hypothetical protein WBL80_00475 [Erysipelotrichaceae bacterium]